MPNNKSQTKKRTSKVKYKNILEASLAGDLQTIKLFIEKQGKKILKSKDSETQKTCLHLLVESGNEDAVNYVLGFSEIDVFAKDHNKMTAREIALENEETTIAQLIKTAEKSRNYPVRQPNNPYHEKNCVWTPTRIKTAPVVYQAQRRDHFHEDMEVVPITDDVMHVTLLRRSKERYKLKGKLKLDGIHNDLRRSVAMSGESVFRSGNVIAVEMSFEIKVNNESRHHFVTIPIVVGKKKIFSMTDTLELYGLDADEELTGTTEQDIYQMLQYLYNKGRKKAKLSTHGQGLDFSGNNQDIRKLHHSEKALALYLTSDKGCQNIVAALIVEIEKHGVAKPGDKIKVSTITLHLHSNRATCGSCELVLFGLQHLRYFHPDKRDKKFSGFLHKIETELLREKDKFIFSTPKKMFIYTEGEKQGRLTYDRIRMFTTVSSDYLDKETHRSEFTTKCTDWDDRTPTVIQTNKDEHRQRIYVCNFGKGIAKTQKREPVMRHSIFSSGANSNQHVKADNRRLEKYKIAGNESEISFSACDSDYSSDEESSSTDSLSL